MFLIDPDRTDLVAAFEARPFGPHPPELAALVDALRLEPIDGKYVLLADVDGGFELAQLSAQPGVPPRRLGVRFTDLADAERDVFRRRWQARTGRTLDGGA